MAEATKMYAWPLPGRRVAIRHPRETDEQFQSSVDYVNGWNACLDLLKELRQTPTNTAIVTPPPAGLVAPTSDGGA